MSNNAAVEPLLPPDEEEGFMAKRKKETSACLKKACKYCVLGFASLFLLAFIIQLIIYFGFITLGCGPRAIGDIYHFPGGGKSKIGGPEYNLLPQDYLLSERERSWWGWPVDVIPSSIAASASSAQVGTWWRNSGPLWYTYTYEDIQNSKLTAYMRMNIFVPWMSYKIARCDGKGPVITFTENGYWVHNKIRKFFRMNQAQSYSVYFDHEKVAEAQEVTNGYPSLTVSNSSTGDEITSSILSGRHFHGDMDQWYVHNKYAGELPYYAAAAMTLPFAYSAMEDKSVKAFIKDVKDKPAPTEAPTFFLTPVGAGLKAATREADLDKANVVVEQEKASLETATKEVDLTKAPVAVEQQMPASKVVAAEGPTEEKSVAIASTALAQQHV